MNITSTFIYNLFPSAQDVNTYYITVTVVLATTEWKSL